MRRLVLLLCVALTLSLSPVRAATPPAAESASLPAELAEFDAYVESVRKTFDVPGIAIAESNIARSE